MFHEQFKVSLIIVLFRFYRTPFRVRSVDLKESSQTSSEFDWKSLLSTPVRNTVEDDATSTSKNEKWFIIPTNDDGKKKSLRFASKTPEQQKELKAKQNREAQRRYRERNKKILGIANKRQVDLKRIREKLQNGEKMTEQERRRFKMYQNERIRARTAKRKKRALKKLGIS